MNSWVASNVMGAINGDVKRLATAENTALMAPPIVPCRVAPCQLVKRCAWRPSTDSCVRSQTGGDECKRVRCGCNCVASVLCVAW